VTRCLVCTAEWDGNPDPAEIRHDPGCPWDGYNPHGNLGDENGLLAIYEDAAAEVNVMMVDAADEGEEAAEAAYPDIVNSVAARCTPEIAAELKRRLL
jgi:hypothetical protein